MLAGITSFFMIGPKRRTSFVTKQLKIAPETDAPGAAGPLGPLTSPLAARDDALAAHELIDKLPIGVFIFRVAAPGRFVCRMANRFVERLFGFEPYYALGLTTAQLPLLQQGEPFQSHFESCVASGRTVSFEWRLARAPDEQFLSCQVTPLADEDGAIIELLGTITDRSSERQAERQMRYNAQHDNLTGLPNRLRFQEHLDQVLSSNSQGRSHTAILVLNVDRFQLINESMGHIAGDEFLIALASRLKTLLGPGHCLARFNSDEFAVMIDQTDSIETAIALANQMHDALTAPFNLGGERVYATISIGISTSEISPGGSEDVIRDADFAMHRAKLMGKARTEIYRYAVHHHAREQFQLETELRRALENDRLELHYQPIISVADQKLVGFEALARWPHERRGYISPVEFIPLAEGAGLIIPLGRWALRKACEQAEGWRRDLGARAHGLQISVNVSGLQLSRDDIVATTRDALDASGFDGRLLRLELTESALVENPEAAANTLHALKALNLKLALDDFGTGYSSLSYLQRLPFDIIKIDRSFVRDIEERGENFKLVEIISMLAQRLGMDVVAEGIETPEQLLLIKALGCRYGQGYYFSRPMNEADVVAYLTGQKSRAASVR